jgi:copper chaperone CopZ
MARQEVTLRAPKISCGGCVRAIRKTVTALPSVEFVEGSPATKLVTLTYEPELVSLEHIKRAMDERGFRVEA